MNNSIGYRYEREHDFVVISPDQKFYMYVWVIDETPKFRFLTKDMLKGGLLTPKSLLKLSESGVISLCHDGHDQGWFELNQHSKDNIKNSGLFQEKYKEWSVDKILIGS